MSYILGERVRLAHEEGLDIPESCLGKVGFVVEIHEWSDPDLSNSYSVFVPEAGEVAFCEYYHILESLSTGMNLYGQIKQVDPDLGEKLARSLSKFQTIPPDRLIMTILWVAYDDLEKLESELRYQEGLIPE